MELGQEQMEDRPTLFVHREKQRLSLLHGDVPVVRHLVLPSGSSWALGMVEHM